MKKLIVLLLIVASYISCKTPDVSSEISNIKFSDEAELIAYVDSIFQTSKLPGLSYTVLDENGIIFNRSFGYSDISANKKFSDETVLNIASISKTIIAVALMKAVDEGYVTLDEDINTYLPFKVSNPNHPNKKITLRQLSTHTSSILDTEVYAKAYYIYDAHKLKESDFGADFAENFKLLKDNDLIDDAEFLENVLSADGQWYDNNIFSSQAPGIESNYSNIGASLAAFVIECASKTKYEDYTAQKIFQPLGMTSTTWKIDNKTKANFAQRYYDLKTPVPPYYLITKADGGLYTSVNDFSKFMQEMIKGEQGKGTVLSDEGFETMFSVQLKINEQLSGGIFWEFPYNKGFAHDGSDPGVTTRTSYNRERQRALIFFCNVEATEESMPGINKIWDAVALYDWK